ncbi:AMMECR1 domain-containing protein [Vibrio sp. PP-XX7]
MSALAVVQAAIGGLFTDEVSLPPQLALFPRTLTQPGACFVTLEVGGQLQGCLGSVSAQSPLILDVYHKARASAC